LEEAAIEVRHRPLFHVELLLGLCGLSRVNAVQSQQELVSSRQFSRKWRTAFSKGKLEENV
jgi:hypothetical protein